jgi:hypothetical protein
MDYNVFSGEMVLLWQNNEICRKCPVGNLCKDCLFGWSFQLCNQSSPERKSNIICRYCPENQDNRQNCLLLWAWFGSNNHQKGKPTFLYKKQ